MTTATIDLLDLDRFQRLEHHDMFTRLRAEDPVSWHDYPGGKGFWNVVRHEDVVDVNRDSELFSSEVGGVSIMDPEAQGGFDTRGVMMLYTDPPKHTRYRLLVNKGFTPRMIGLLEQYLRHRSRMIVDNVIERGSCDFVVDLASELPLQAIAEIMGVPQEDRHLLFQWSNAMIGADDPDFEGGIEGRARGVGRSSTRTPTSSPRSGGAIRATTSSPSSSTPRSTARSCRSSSSTCSCCCCRWRATRPPATPPRGACGRSCSTPSSTRRCATTSIRNSTPRSKRSCAGRRPSTTSAARRPRPTEIRGREIAEGDKVVMWYISANRDEAVFDDPFRFDITRDPEEQVAFGGGGHHFCLGANLARMELKLIFQEVLERIPDMHLVGDPEILRSNFIGGIKHMPVEYTPGARRGSDAA